MPVKVTVDISYETHKDVTDSSKFGYVVPASQHVGDTNQTVPPIRVWRIDDTCYGDEKRTMCRCDLTAVDIMLHVAIHLNSGKIANSYFDTDPEKPHGYTGQQRDPSHPQLDEASVTIHEMSHAKDIANAIQKAVSREFNKSDPPFSICACKQLYLCHQDLVNQASSRVAAIGMDAFNDIFQEAQQHGTNSETEQRARAAQIADFAARE